MVFGEVKSGDFLLYARFAIYFCFFVNQQNVVNLTVSHSTDLSESNHESTEKKVCFAHGLPGIPDQALLWQRESRNQDTSGEHNHSIPYRGTRLPANINIFRSNAIYLSRTRKKRSGCKYISLLCYPVFSRGCRLGGKFGFFSLLFHWCM